MKKVTCDNFKELLKGIFTTDDEFTLMKALLDDAEMYNHNGVLPHNIEIWVEDNHTDYSPERTDPCPDDYGTFSLFWEGFNDSINNRMTLHELDWNMCTLLNCIEQLQCEDIIDKFNDRV